VGENPRALRDLVGSGTSAAVIFNARDAVPSERLNYVEQEFGSLRVLGFRTEELDLRAFFGDTVGLRANLRAYDLVFVVGGNTFVLARAMAESGFGVAIGELLEEDRIVYAGYSAGACIVGPDLDGCHLIDEADVVADGFTAEVEPRALGWLPWRIVPHFRSEHEEAPLAQLAVEYLLGASLPFQALRDGQAFVVNGRRRYLA
jgi:dipeptidase E